MDFYVTSFCFVSVCVSCSALISFCISIESFRRRFSTRLRSVVSSCFLVMI